MPRGLIRPAEIVSEIAAVSLEQVVGAGCVLLQGRDG